MEGNHATGGAGQGSWTFSGQFAPGAGYRRNHAGGITVDPSGGGSL